MPGTAPNLDPNHDMGAYRAFFEFIGYLPPRPHSVRVSTANVYDEIASLAGPQLADSGRLPLEKRLSKKPSKPQPIDAHVLLVNPDLAHAFFPSNAQNSSQAIGGRSLEITYFIKSFRSLPILVCSLP
jgi:hypothetical protein